MIYHVEGVTRRLQWYFNRIVHTATHDLFYLDDALVHAEPREK